MWRSYLLPRFINCACGIKPFYKQREKVVPQACGTVLEIGFGSGLNLPHYRADQVDKIYALEPEESIVDLAQQHLEHSALKVDMLHAGAEDIPLPSDCIDSVVCTYTLCTIPDVAASLAEIRRVMKPQAKMWFSEHGLAPDPSVSLWQDRLNPIWSKIAGGCHLNRNVPQILRDNGMHIGALDQMYLPGSRVFMYHSWGWAQ